jgi:hypothetical protein
MKKMNSTLVVILFDKDFTVKKAYKMPHEVIKKYGSYSKHQNGYILTVNQKVINDISVVDISKYIKPHLVPIRRAVS